jgi:hypothetical protein
MIKAIDRLTILYSGIIGGLESLRNPMSCSREIHKEVVWNHGYWSEPSNIRVFHILDSLPNGSLATKEENQLQSILLKHFEGAAFKVTLVSLLFFNSSNNLGSAATE